MISPVIPSRVRGCEKRNDRCDVVRLADASQRCLRDHLLLKIASRHSQGVKAFGLDRSRINRIHPDLLWPKLVRQHTGDHIPRTFGRGID